MVCGSLSLSASTTLTAGSRSTSSLPRPSIPKPGATSNERSPRPRAWTFSPPPDTGTTPGVCSTRLCKRRFSRWYASAAFQSSSVVKKPSKKLIRLKLACSAIASSKSAPPETTVGAVLSIQTNGLSLLTQGKFSQLFVLRLRHVFQPADARVDADAAGLADMQVRHRLVGGLGLFEDQRVVRVRGLLGLDQRLHGAQPLA